MAKIPQKSKDAAEEALSAIQQALSARQPEPFTDTNNEDRSRLSGGTDLFKEDTLTIEPGDESGQWRAANDDRASIGQILQALHGRRARVPYLVGGAAAVLWIIGSLAAFLMFRPDIQGVLKAPQTGFAATLALIGAIGLPAIFFLVLAHIFRRSQDLRLVAESMAEVAMRLA
ncbi:MAG: hypothetical protein ACRD5Z_04375, partial [Bryobacteraceae bacterium]